MQKTCSVIALKSTTRGQYVLLNQRNHNKDKKSAGSQKPPEKEETETRHFPSCVIDSLVQKMSTFKPSIVILACSLRTHAYTHTHIHIQYLALGALCVVSPCRPTQLPGRQSPAVARAGGADVLLVAPDRRAHHALPPQPGLPDGADWRRRQ